MMLLRIVLLLAVTGAWVTFTVTQASAGQGQVQPSKSQTATINGTKGKSFKAIAKPIPKH